jgi:hypothetical protein
MSRREAVLAIIYTTSGTHLPEKKDDVAFGLSSSLFFLFLLFLSLSHVPQVLPLVYKRIGWAPHLEGFFSTLRSTSTPSSLETWDFIPLASL